MSQGWTCVRAASGEPSSRASAIPSRHHSRHPERTVPRRSAQRQARRAETFNGTLTISGTVTPQGLLDLSGSGAGQIKFPATQNASSDANTLDDYEEGTFTPTFSAASTPPSSVTYAGGGQQGWYTKKGRDVSIKVQLTLTSKGSGGVGDVLIGGFPFTSEATAATPAPFGTYCSLVNLTAGYTQVTGYLSNNSTSAHLRETGDNIADQDVTWAAIANTSNFQFGGVYNV